MGSEPRGLGFIEYYDERDAADAVRSMDRMVLGGREVWRWLGWAREGLMSPACSSSSSGGSGSSSSSSMARIECTAPWVGWGLATEQQQTAG